MTDRLAILRPSHLPPSVDDALAPWFGWTPDEADAYAGDPATQDGLDPDRLLGLLTLLATSLPDGRRAPLAALLLHRAAPVARTADDLRDAARTVSAWLDRLSDGAFLRIVAAHEAYEAVMDALVAAGMAPGDDDAARLHASMGDDVLADDHVVAPLGDHALVVQIASDRWICCILDGERLLVVDAVPFDRGGRGPGDGADAPAPREPVAA